MHRVLRTPDGTIRLLVQGLERIRIVEYIQEQPYLRARVEILPETMDETIELEAIMRAVQELFRRLIDLEPQMPDELAVMAMNVDDARQLAYLVASSMRLDAVEAQRILEMDSVHDKLLRLTHCSTRKSKCLELGRKIQSEAQGEMERMQRDFFLREQMKAIQKELGEEDEQAADIRELEERIVAAGYVRRSRKGSAPRTGPHAAHADPGCRIQRHQDLSGLDGEPALAEGHRGQPRHRPRDARSWTKITMVWTRSRSASLSFWRCASCAPSASATKPEEDLRDKIRREREGVVLCFVGPPGVGKTSLGISIARAMNRKFVRLALGGIRDEAEIRGFRRTYIGSMPGRIIQSLRRIESRNPVFMLDEVDKLGRDFRGDPSSALLEVLDPEQNREFRDHYLDVPFDLSQVMFITTANVLDTIPSPLRDRMEIIQLSSYTEDEKVKIVQGYLIPRQIKENGLKQDEVEFTEDALREIVQGYTREAGVRNLERQIGKVCRKIAAKVAAGTATDEAPVKNVVDVADLPAYLGRRKFHKEEVAERAEHAGCRDRAGVDHDRRRHHVLRSDRCPATKALRLTGQLGDVMKESAQAAFSYVRSRAVSLGIDPSSSASRISICTYLPAPFPRMAPAQASPWRRPWPACSQAARSSPNWA